MSYLLKVWFTFGLHLTPLLTSQINRPQGEEDDGVGIRREATKRQTRCPSTPLPLPRHLSLPARKRVSQLVATTGWGVLKQQGICTVNCRSIGCLIWPQDGSDSSKIGQIWDLFHNVFQYILAKKLSDLSHFRPIWPLWRQIWHQWSRVV